MHELVPVVEATSKRKIELLAEGVLSRFDPYLLVSPARVDVQRIFEFLLPTLVPDLVTDFDRLPQGVEGSTEVDVNRKAKSIVSLDDLDLAETTGDQTKMRRLRFTIGHETAHALMHVPQFQNSMKPYLSEQQVSVAVVHRSTLRPFEDPEWQANFCAGALLMPRGPLGLLVQEGCGLIEIAETFDVNPTAAEVRLKKLGMPIRF